MCRSLLVKAGSSLRLLRCGILFFSSSLLLMSCQVHVSIYNGLSCPFHHATCTVMTKVFFTFPQNGKISFVQYFVAYFIQKNIGQTIFFQFGELKKIPPKFQNFGLILEFGEQTLLAFTIMDQSMCPIPNAHPSTFPTDPNSHPTAFPTDPNWHPTIFPTDPNSHPTTFPTDPNSHPTTFPTNPKFVPGYHLPYWPKLTHYHLPYWPKIRTLPPSLSLSWPPRVSPPTPVGKTKIGKILPKRTRPHCWQFVRCIHLYLTQRYCPLSALMLSGLSL